jgi:hypothetical protein
MNQPLLIAAGIGLLVCLYGCEPQYDNAETGDVQAYVPVYLSAVQKNDVTVSTPRPTEKAGKIYAYGNYIFQNDLNKGIHIIDNTDRLHPQKIAFLNIAYNSEMAVKGSYIYANNGNDLLVIDVRDVMHPAVVKRLQNAFPYVNQQYPPQHGYFVCPEADRGPVVDWELQTVKSPRCKR